MEQFDAYSHAIASVALTAILALLLSPLSALRKTAAGVTSGGTPPEDYSNLAYRWNRAYLNLCENIGPFVAVTGAAILAGASPFWINLFASLYFLSRCAVAYVHIKGIGAENQGPRSMIYVFGWALCVLTGLAAVFAAL